MIKGVHHSCSRKHQGFTLIELMLALAFLTFMLLFVVTSLVNMMATYNKGLVYKGINQTGRVLVEEISRNIRISPSSGTNTSAVANGRLCTGGKVYVWNIKSNPAYANVYTTGGTGLIEGMVRVDDPASSYCADITKQIPRSAATIIVDSAVAIRALSINPTNGGHLLAINTLLTTQADDTFEPGGSFICKGGKAGEFCASVNINTAVSVRNTGGN